jgi:hypothetical protein
VLSLKTCLEGGNLLKQIMHAPWCPFNNFHQDHMQRTSMGGQQALLCRKYIVACGKWASKGLNERVWAVEHAGTKVTKGRSSRWRKAEIGEARGHPGRSAQAGWPPLQIAPPVLVFGRRAALSFPYLCAHVFKCRTTIDLDILSKLVCSNNSHP